MGYNLDLESLSVQEYKALLNGSCANCADMNGCEMLKPVLDNSEEARSNLKNLR